MLKGNQSHPYHLVDVSPLPFLASIALFTNAVNIVQLISGIPVNFLGSVLILTLIVFQLFRDIVREAKGGHHTRRVQHGILLAFVLFLVTEIMLFFSFFLAFFHGSLAPGVEIGAILPPLGVNAVNTLNLPLMGSTVLVSSGFVLTLSHHALMKGDKDLALFTMLLTIILGFSFVFIQYNEYINCEFTIADSVLGSVFFMTTGLHAIHVIAGTLFLVHSYIRIYLDQITTTHNLSLEFSIYYYHLVDVVLLLVFLIYYLLGGS